MDSAAVFLFDLFRSDPQWSRSHAQEIRCTLGPYPASVATKACNIVSQILTYLPKQLASQEDGQSAGKSLSPHRPSPPKLKKEFGLNIVFKFDEKNSKSKSEVTHTETRTGGLEGGFRSKIQANSGSKDAKFLFPLHKPSSGYDSLSDEEEGRPNIVTSALLNGIKSGPPPSEVPKEKKITGAKKMSSSAAAPYTGAWLKQQCQECTKHGLLGISWQDLYSAVFEHLSSTHDNTAIQNDVSSGILILCCNVTLVFVPLTLFSVLDSLIPRLPCMTWE